MLSLASFGIFFAESRIAAAIKEFDPKYGSTYVRAITGRYNSTYKAGDFITLFIEFPLILKVHLRIYELIDKN